MFYAGNPKFVLTVIPVSLESSSQRDRIVSSAQRVSNQSEFHFLFICETLYLIKLHSEMSEICVS